MAEHAGKQSSSHYRPSVRSVLLGTFFSITLAISFFSAGFAVDTLPATTATLSRLFTNFNLSVYLPEDTTELAVATRDYTVESYSSGEAAATEVLAHKVMDAAARSSANDSPKATLWRTITLPTTGTATEQMYALAKTHHAYSLGPDEISHLQDCNKIIRIAAPVLIVIAALALILGIILGASCGRRALGHALIAAPAVLLLAMVGLGVWAIVDFNAFFSAFHGVFFPQGNWTFPADSLLICMLPTAFWVGMVAIWAFITITLSILSVFIGRKLSRAYN